MSNIVATAAVSLTLTPAASTVQSYSVSAAVALVLTPLPRGARYVSYTDENGADVPIYLAEYYKGRDIQQANRKLKYARVFLIHGTFETTDCLDIGPQIGDLDDVIPTMIVANRKLAWYAQGGGASDIVRLDVDYETADGPQDQGGSEDEGTFSYEFTSESDHVDLAIAQTHTGAQPAAGESLLINLDKLAGTVDGLDIESPVEELTERHPFTEAEFDPSFRQLLRDSVAKVNSVAWREFAIGEVLFSGASAAKTGKNWYVTFRFRIRRGFTQKAFTVYTNGVAGAVKVDKKGWDYLWVNVIRDKVDGDATKLQTSPASIHVAQVYETMDFSTLGIGTKPMP